MPYLYLALSIVASAMLSIMSSAFKRVNSEVPDTASFYNVIVTVSAVACWGVRWAFDFFFSPKILLYALLYGIFYTMAMTGLFKAIEFGSVSLTSFVKQLSLIAVSVWGFIFWGAPVTPLIIVGMALIVLSLYLCFAHQKGDTGGGVSLKWLLAAALLLAGNAGASIVQKYQQMEFSGKGGSALMFFATAFSALACIVIYLKGRLPEVSRISKPTLLCPIVGGVSSTLLNAFIILMLSSTLSTSIIFPGIAVGGMILTILFSVAVYKERLSAIRWLGLAVGALALVLLNI